MLTRRQKLYANSQRNRRVAYNSYKYGWPIDRVKQQEIAELISGEITKCDEGLTAEIERLKKQEEDKGILKFLNNFNANSSHQKARLLYDILEEPIRIRTKQGAPGTGKDALAAIEKTGQGPAKTIAALLKKRKQFAKLEESYIHNLSGIEIVRPAAHVTAQLSGRWSYKDPALQTVPQAIKPMFVSHPGTWMVLCDLAGAEYRTMALQAGCVGMLNAFNADRDLHKNTASVLFGVPEDKVTGPQRKIAKGVGLGFHYSVLDFEGAAAGLYGQVGHLAPGLTYELVLGAIKRLAKARPEIMAFKEAIWQRAQKEDYVEEPLLQRQRRFYGKPKNTEAYNFPQQAMIAAIVDLAIQGIDAEFYPKEGLYLQRHDELVIGGPDAPRLCRLLWQHLRQTHTINNHNITFEIEYTITQRWGEGVDIVPKKAGKIFNVECKCGYATTHNDLTSAVNHAMIHYYACKKMEGPPWR